MISAARCHAARAMVETLLEFRRSLPMLKPRWLRLSNIGVESRRSDHQMHPNGLEALARCSSARRGGGGTGVRLKFDRASTRRIAALEGEAGIAHRMTCPASRHADLDMISAAPSRGSSRCRAFAEC